MATMIATRVEPGTIKVIDGKPFVALVGFDAEGNTCLKWYVPKTARDIRAARRCMQEAR